MKPCKDNNLTSPTWNKRFWFHEFKTWSDPQRACYMGEETIIQSRECRKCGIVQVREC